MWQDKGCKASKSANHKWLMASLERSHHFWMKFFGIVSRYLALNLSSNGHSDPQAEDYQHNL
jgi:hypothetical protein